MKFTSTSLFENIFLASFCQIAVLRNERGMGQVKKSGYHKCRAAGSCLYFEIIPKEIFCLYPEYLRRSSGIQDMTPLQKCSRYPRPPW